MHYDDLTGDVDDLYCSGKVMLFNFSPNPNQEEPNEITLSYPILPSSKIRKDQLCILCVLFCSGKIKKKRRRLGKNTVLFH